MGNIFFITMKFVALLLATASATTLSQQGVFYARDNGRGPEGFKYTRVPPMMFSGPGDDQLTRSMIMNYAEEAKTKIGDVEDVPSGHFFMGKAAAKRAASEVLATHKGISGAENKAYLEEYFPRTWDHFDVNGSGSIEVEKMQSFLRFFLSDQYVQFH